MASEKIGKPKRRGRPATGRDPSVAVRLPVEALKAVDQRRGGRTRSAVIREIVLAALANASRPVQPATPKPKRTPRQLSPEQHQRLMRQEAADRAEALALARSRQAEAEARARAVTKANADTTRCPKCGRSYALVGRSHLCSPTEIA